MECCLVGSCNLLEVQAVMKYAFKFISEVVCCLQSLKLDQDYCVNIYSLKVEMQMSFILKGDNVGATFMGENVGSTSFVEHAKTR